MQSLLTHQICSRRIELTIIDLFSGCGGLSLGFQQAGFNIVKAFDNWDKAVNVYNLNFKHSAEQVDVCDLTVDYLKKFKPTMIVGGPPCQDYSSAGKRNENNGRAELTLVYANLVCGVTPKWFIMENVDRILKSKTLPAAIKMFKESGYGVSKVVLDASRCGVPQIRKRFFMIGELGGRDGDLETALMNGQSEKRTTVRDYLGDEIDTEYIYRHPRSYARRAIFSIDEPSPTIRGVNRPIPKTYKCHPGDVTHDLNKVRPLTTLERARIQTFPKEFKFIGCKTDLELMIGNAVPVNLALYVARTVLAYINGNIDTKAQNAVQRQLSLFG